VRGYVEVLPHLMRLLRMRKALGDRLIEQPPKLFIGIDAPDFNLDLEVRLRAAGIPTLHFVSPSFWAWRAKKVEKLRRAADHVLCIFPFEPELLAEHGIAATFVGHPLASSIALQPDKRGARQQLGYQDSDTVIALLPGSRESEIRHLAGRFFSAARQMLLDRPALRFVVPAIPTLRADIERVAASSGLGEALQIVSGQSHTVLAACDVTLIASGTATLEAALFKRPMVIAYHMPWLSWQIMKGKQLQAWVGLPNILCRDFVVPELIQDAATPDNLAQAVIGWLDAPEKMARVRDRFERLHLELRQDTAQLSCEVIQKLCEPNKN
jgi:lipid-A-disaccharide synthase